MAGPKVAVLGTGANGGSIGADLTRAEVDVTLIEQWPAHVEAMRANGLTVEMTDGTEVTPVSAIHLCQVAELREKFDIVLVLMKAYDTRWACELIKPYVKTDGLVVGLQNGMTVDVMLDVFGPERVLGSVIEQSAAMYAPGLIERHTLRSGSWFGVGSLTAATAGRELEVVDLLKHSGSVEIFDDIRSAKWMKLVVNCAELVTTAIVDLPMTSAAQLPGMHRVMLEAGYEAVRTAVAAGHRVLPIFGLGDLDQSRPEEFVDRMLDAVMKRFSLPQTKTTVLHDWMKSRHSEVDELNGYVVEVGAAVGVPTPVNALVTDIAHRIERGDLQRNPENVSLLVDAGLV